MNNSRLWPGVFAPSGRYIACASCSEYDDVVSEAGTRAVAAAHSGGLTLVGLLMNVGSAPRPPEALNALMDATERAVSRNGLRRTTMSDLAREMNVARTTLYRQVDSVDEAIVLAGARAMYRFLDEVTRVPPSGTDWSNMFIDGIVDLLAQRFDNPLLRRLVEHEPELLGEALSQDGLSVVVSRLAETVAGVFETAMATGHLGRTDSRLMAESLIRVILALMLCRPIGDVREMVEFMLSPMLNPAAPGA